MPDFSGTIENFVSGDDLQITRTITNVPSGAALTRAWFTVKLLHSATDDDAVIQKEITTSNVAGTGHITDDGAGDQSAAVRFDLADTDTAKLQKGLTFLYDIQVLTDGGAIYTPEIGTITAKQGVTVDTS